MAFFLRLTKISIQLKPMLTKYNWNVLILCMYFVQKRRLGSGTPRSELSMEN